jgi:hypothetical protein
MALAAHGISISGQLSTPSTLNAWLQHNSGYAGDNDLEESAVVFIDESRVRWLGYYYNNTALPPDTIKQMLMNEVVVIANVRAVWCCLCVVLCVNDVLCAGDERRSLCVGDRIRFG